MANSGPGEISIRWDSIENAKGYSVYMHTFSNVGVHNHQEKMDTDQNEFLWGGLANGTTYYFVVTAHNSY